MTDQPAAPVSEARPVFDPSRAQAVGNALASRLLEVAHETPTTLTEIIEATAWFFANTILVAAASAPPDFPLDVTATTANACARATRYVRDHVMLQQLDTKGSRN